MNDLEQFALFDEDEIPEYSVDSKMSHEVVAHHIKPWTARSGVTQKMAREVINSAEKYINSHDTSVEEIASAFGDEGFLLGVKKLTPEEVEHGLSLAGQHATAMKLLEHWSSRRSLSARSISRSTLAVAEALKDGTDEHDLKYALSQKGLLASTRLLSAKIIQDAIAGVEKDKEAGVIGNSLFRKWYGKYYQNRYTQPVGQIVQVIKKGLLDGIDPDTLERALELTGQDGIPITENSIQYGTVKAEKEKELRGDAGAFVEEVGTQEEITSRLFTGDYSSVNDAADYKEMF